MISFFKIKHPLSKTGNWFIEFGFEPRDMWWGLFWDVKEREFEPPGSWGRVHFYVCVIPCFVFHVWEE